MYLHLEIKSPKLRKLLHVCWLMLEVSSTSLSLVRVESSSGMTDKSIGDEEPAAARFFSTNPNS